MKVVRLSKDSLVGAPNGKHHLACTGTQMKTILQFIFKKQIFNTYVE